MFAALTASLVLAAAPQDAPQTPATGPIAIEDVVVDGRRLEAMAEEFIEDVAAPTRRRGLARWNSRLCVGVANLRPDLARAIADRVSDVAGELGVQIGEPGCRANALIVAADDGAAMATAMVNYRRRGFDLGSRQATQSDEALEAFMSEQRPVRWWQVSFPTDSNTGQRAIRLAGDIGPGGQPSAPTIHVFAASRLHSQIRDDLSRVFIIVDMDDVQGLNSVQLSDYLAMVVLAQIDAEADASAYDTVLNLFRSPDTTSGLTAWDMAYLRALYGAQQNRIDPNQQAAAVADGIVRERRQAAAGTPVDAE